MNKGDVIMVVSKKLWTPQTFVEAITGKCYIIEGDDDVGLIDRLLEENDHGDLWNYPIDEIDHIVENSIPVVLIDCMVYNEDKEQYEHEYRWWEIPENKIEWFKNN
jgi:hypothetical protein